MDWKAWCRIWNCKRWKQKLYLEEVCSARDLRTADSINRQYISYITLLLKYDRAHKSSSSYGNSVFKNRGPEKDLRQAVEVSDGQVFTLYARPGPHTHMNRL